MRRKTTETIRLLKKCKKAFRRGQISKAQYQATLILLFDNMSVIEQECCDVEFIVHFLNDKAKENPLFDDLNFSFCLN
jgi:hypothetical protein